MKTGLERIEFQLQIRLGVELVWLCCDRAVILRMSRYFTSTFSFLGVVLYYVLKHARSKQSGVRPCPDHINCMARPTPLVLCTRALELSMVRATQRRILYQTTCNSGGNCVSKHEPTFAGKTQLPILFRAQIRFLTRFSMLADGRFRATRAWPAGDSELRVPLPPTDDNLTTSIDAGTSEVVSFMIKWYT